MPGTTLLALTPAIVLSCLAVVELFFRLPFLARVEAVNGGALRALEVVRSPRISDHWKEKVLPRYAGRILGATLGLAGLLLLCVAVFTVTWMAAAYWPAGGAVNALDALGRGDVQLWLLLFGVGWAVLRSRLRRQTEPVSDYSAASQMLHRLALASTGMRTLQDDLDRRIAGRRVDALPVDRPVYVTALARAGTTVLLEALHRSGRFTSMTYRSMPFVMAPWCWGALSRPGRSRAGDARERAHGDRLEISVDSPEAFEEIFWNSWAERATRSPEGLVPAGEPDPEVIERYRNFVRRILARGAGADGPHRYLCKNNNNLLRLPWLFEAFPDAVVITPFRDPADHVRSLLRQHRRFLDRHAQDPFSLEYMDWLGHHEFGAHFRPFLLGEDARPGQPKDLLEPAYWVNYWTAVYRFLLERHGDQVLWFDHDRFCAAPEQVLVDLGERLGLNPGALAGFAERVSAPTPAPKDVVSTALTVECRDVHAALKARAAF